MYTQNRERGPGGRQGGKKFSDRGSWGGGAGGRDQNRTMYSAICSDCGSACEVPFKPVSGRAIFCSNCFKKEGNAPPRRSDGSDFQKPAFGDKQMHKAVCSACGNACEVPFRPVSGKPIYCKQCFGKDNAPVNKSAEQSSKEDFRVINAKLDAILKALTPAASAPPAKAPAASKKSAAPKKVAKKKPAPKKKK